MQAIKIIPKLLSSFVLIIPTVCFAYNFDIFNESSKSIFVSVDHSQSHKEYPQPGPDHYSLADNENEFNRKNGDFTGASFYIK